MSESAIEAGKVRSEGPASAENPTPAEGSAPAENPAPAEGPAPAENPAPAEGPAPAENPAPAESAAEATEAPGAGAPIEAPTAAATTAHDGTDAAVIPRARTRVTVHLAGMTDVGRIREHNEDNLLVADLSTRSRDASLFDTSLDVGDRGLLLAVCDGMGGALAGEVASKMAVDVIHGIVQGAGAARDGDHFAQKLVGAVQEAGARIYLAAKTNRNQHGMGTTATVAGIFGEQLFVSQVGDSRAYVLRQGRLRQVTKDQSLVSKLIEAGQLTEDEAESYEHAHIILQALGTSDAVCVDLSYVDLRYGDVLMLCSDGLSGLATHEQIREVLASGAAPALCARRLVDCANEAGGHDNITVIVARFEGDLPQPTADDALPGYQAHVLSQPVEALVAGLASTTLKVPDLPPPGADLKHRLSFPPGETGETDEADEAERSVQARVESPTSTRTAAEDDDLVLPVGKSPWTRVVIVAAILGAVIGLWLALRAPETSPPRTIPETVDGGLPETPVSPGLPVEPTSVPEPNWGDAAASPDR